MSSVTVAALVRHLLTAIAGGLAVKYNIDGSTVEGIVGGLAALTGVVWSLQEKRTRNL